MTLHATCVALGEQAVMITGGSGSGKSTLGLMLLALGCDLVADDGVVISVVEGSVFADCLPTIAGMIEARGVGILNAPCKTPVKVALVVDLDQTETERLPQRRFITLLGCDVPLIYRVEGPQFAPAIVQILKAGWSDR